jgi:hypothetical protein
MFDWSDLFAWRGDYLASSRIWMSNEKVFLHWTKVVDARVHAEEGKKWLRVIAGNSFILYGF